MSERNHFVVWKGVRSGPFSKEELEKEFTDGRIGLVRSVVIGGVTISGRDFVADLETKRREEELEEQLRLQAIAAEAAHLELERQRERHQAELEAAAAKQPAGKSIPPPIPDVNPWAPASPFTSVPAPQRAIRPSPPQFTPGGDSWWDGKGPVILAALLCLLCFLLGQIFREISGFAALSLGIVLLARKRITAGAVLIVSALLAYGGGYLLAELVHDYLNKNYPN